MNVVCVLFCSRWSLFAQWDLYVGGLKKNPGNYHYQSEHWVVRDSDGDYTLEEAKEVVKFMRRSLRLNPKDRVSAEELLQDPWLSDAVAGQ